MTWTSSEKYVGMFVEAWKVPSILPFYIQRTYNNLQCKYCKTRHREFTIQKFDKETESFTVIHGDNKVGITDSNIYNAVDLKKFLLDCFKRRDIKLWEIRRDLDLSDVKKNEFIRFRVSKREKIMAKNKAKNLDMSLGEYGRWKIFG